MRPSRRTRQKLGYQYNRAGTHQAISDSLKEPPLLGWRGRSPRGGATPSFFCFQTTGTDGNILANIAGKLQQGKDGPLCQHGSGRASRLLSGSPAPPLPRARRTSLKLCLTVVILSHEAPFSQWLLSTGCALARISLPSPATTWRLHISLNCAANRREAVGNAGLTASSKGED